MSDTPKKLKIVFAPGALDNMVEELGVEEAQKMIDHITQQVASGDIFESADPVNLDELEQTDPELYAQIVAQLESVDLDNPQQTLH